MELVSRKLVFTFNGERKECNYPTVKQLSEFEKAKEGMDALESLTSFLGRLGLDESLVQELEPSHLTQIVDELSGVKKK